MFDLLKRKDPVCSMKEQAGKGMEKYGKWFCNSNCLNEYELRMKKN